MDIYRHCYYVLLLQYIKSLKMDVKVYFFIKSVTLNYFLRLYS